MFRLIVLRRNDIRSRPPMFAAKRNGANGWFGWPSDDKIEALRTRWPKATTLDERKKLAAAIDETRLRGGALHPNRAMDAGDRLSQELEGRHPGPPFLMWNVEKL